ncbi:hypothetical protein QBC32DRAFT_118674 [Pseudoneurospora amorphoporcata]|uniref:Uncharacterized protein n=1 Tax=Pseudoneurospora amorphoporcata TaxID=241081 RepID=A0AAN6P0T6_9PEZI|nr:hypothetical protein QBC32DRAFT_118674 [Pseudoneurospora amorphoporcata]
MASKYLSPLLLAGSAAAFQFHGNLNRLAANNAVNAVATTDAGFKACAAVSSVVMSCSAAGSVAENVPEASQAACVCCQGNNELDPVYSSCAAYVNTALQDPSLAAVYGAVYTVCASYRCGAAAAPTTTEPPTTVATTIRATITSAPVVPAACSSVVSIASRCAAGAEDKVLSCLCHDTSGKTNTQVQNWASSCLPWAKSNSPEDVTVVEALETICAAGAGASSLSAKATESSGDESSVTNRPAFGLPTGTASSRDDDVTTSATQTRIVETEAPAVSSSRSSAAGGLVQQPLGGVAAWVVNGLVAVAGYLVV